MARYYPEIGEDAARDYALMLSVIAVMYSDLEHSMSIPADQLQRRKAQDRDNLAEVIYFFKGPLLTDFCGCSPDLEPAFLREEIACHLRLKTHGSRSLLVLPAEYVDRIEDFCMEVVCA
jgi:hypothetical protein